MAREREQRARRSEAAATRGESRASRTAAAGKTRALPELDRVIHERMRLAIISALAAEDRLSFHDLKSLLQASDGNLSVHARKLEEAGYVACEKSFEKRTPRTVFRLTAEGRRAFERYLGHLEALVQTSRNRG